MHDRRAEELHGATAFASLVCMGNRDAVEFPPMPFVMSRHGLNFSNLSRLPLGKK
jgi:hypothetical protein